MPVDLGSAYGSIEIGTEGAEQSIQSLAASLRGTGMTMSAAFTLPLVGIATAAVSSAADFEQSMNVMRRCRERRLRRWRGCNRRRFS